MSRIVPLKLLGLGPVVGLLLVAIATSLSSVARAEQACATHKTPAIDTLRGTSLVFDAIDVTPSTDAASLRAQYRRAVKDVIDRAYDDRAALVLLTFTSASASTRVVFAGSFDPHTGDVVMDQGAKNRAKCQAYSVVDHALGPVAPGVRRSSTGSDLPGAVAAGVALARTALAHRMPVAIRLTTDGYLAPAASGINRNLPNLEKELDRATPPARIVERYRDYLLVTSLSGVDYSMVGLDHRGTRQSNTVRAVRLQAFWTFVCRRMHAHSCTVTTSFD